MAFISRKRPNETIEVNEDLGDDNVAPLKMKKRQFPLEFKLQIVSQAKELNNRKVAKMHGLDESCVRSWRKNEEIIRQTLESTFRSNPVKSTGGGRKVMNSQLEEKLFQIICTSETQISRRFIKETALEIAAENDNEQKIFHASDSWCTNFMRRYGLIVSKEDENSEEQFLDLTNTSPQYYDVNEIVIDPQDMIPDDNSDENDDKVKEMLEPFLKHLLDKNFSSYGKIGCINAIRSLIDKDLNVSEYLNKKEIIDELAHIAETIYKRVGNLANMDFNSVARILAKVNESSEGMELIDEMKISFGASKRLFLEMEKFEPVNAYE